MSKTIDWEKAPRDNVTAEKEVNQIAQKMLDAPYMTSALRREAHDEIVKLQLELDAARREGRTVASLANNLMTQRDDASALTAEQRLIATIVQPMTEDPQELLVTFNRRMTVDEMNAFHNRLNAMLLGGGQPPVVTRPAGPEAALDRILACIREIEILADEFGFDPAEWIVEGIGKSVAEPAPPSASAARSGESLSSEGAKHG